MFDSIFLTNEGSLIAQKVYEDKEDKTEQDRLAASLSILYELNIPYLNKDKLLGSVFSVLSTMKISTDYEMMAIIYYIKNRHNFDFLIDLVADYIKEHKFKDPEAFFNRVVEDLVNVCVYELSEGISRRKLSKAYVTAILTMTTKETNQRLRDLFKKTWSLLSE